MLANTRWALVCLQVGGQHFVKQSAANQVHGTQQTAKHAPACSLVALDLLITSISSPFTTAAAAAATHAGKPNYTKAHDP